MYTSQILLLVSLHLYDSGLVKSRVKITKKINITHAGVISENLARYTLRFCLTKEKKEKCSKIFKSLKFPVIISGKKLFVFFYNLVFTLSSETIKTVHMHKDIFASSLISLCLKFNIIAKILLKYVEPYFLYMCW